MSALEGGLDSRYLAFLQGLAGAPIAAVETPQSVAAMRDSAAAARGPWSHGGPAVSLVRDRSVATSLGSVNLRIYYPSLERPLPPLIYLHGGGWTLLDINTHDRIMREYACASGWAVVGIDFPRSPEAPFPIALDVCVDLIAALSVHAEAWGLSPHPTAISGDSSGANLSLAAAIKLRDERGIRVDALILAYGVYDCNFSRPSYATFGEPPHLLSAERMSWFWDQYCPDPGQRSNPLASPLRADLRGLPPIRLITAGHDVLRDENLALAHRLVEAGVAVSLDHYPRTPHGFLEALDTADDGRDAIRHAARWLNETIAPTPKR